MDYKIQKNEKLYRAVKRSRPDWIAANGRPTSAMFKDNEGISVDRDCQRSLDDIIDFMKQVTFAGRLKGVAEIYAEKCLFPPVNARVEAAPSKENPYHANIYLDADIMKSSLQALMLADSSRIVYNDADMQWVLIQ